MLQFKKRTTVNDGYLSDRECIGFLCIFQLLIAFLPCFFWFGMILDVHKKKTMETWDVALMYVILAFSVAMAISTFIGFIRAITENFDVCLIFLKSDIVHCAYFGVTTIGLIILSIFVVMKGEDKMNDYRWTKLINESIGERIIALSVVGSVLFMSMTFLSIMCHGIIRRWTESTKAKLWSDAKMLVPPESEEHDSGILLPTESQVMRHDEMKKLAKEMKENPVMPGQTDPRYLRWMELAREYNGSIDIKDILE